MKVRAAGGTIDDARVCINTAIAGNRVSVEAFTKAHNIVPVPRSFMYCPYDVVENVFCKMNKLGLPEDSVRHEMGLRLW